MKGHCDIIQIALGTYPKGGSEWGFLDDFDDGIGRLGSSDSSFD